MIGVGRHGPTGPRGVAFSRSEIGDEGRDGSPGGGGLTAAVHGTARDTASTGPGTGRLSERDALAVLASVEGVGPVSLERLLAGFGGAGQVLLVATEGGAAALQAATDDPGERGERIAKDTLEGIVSAARDPEPRLNAMQAAGVHVVILGDDLYPGRLLTIELPPRVLFVRGSDTALRTASAVAVVGTRRPTDLGRRTAGRIGAALARAGAAVVSGLALGIDGAAHAAVVEASGVTVAVIGGGHQRLAPMAHDRLAAAIVDGGGAVISEHAPGVEPSRGTFPRRNRIISGLVDAVVVVEAGARSGALLTAAWALEQGRECFFVPGSIESPESAGCLAWLREYAGLTRIVSGVPQLLEDLGLAASAAFPGVDARATSPLRPGRGHNLRPPSPSIRTPSIEAVTLELPAREAALVRGLASGATTADELAAVTALPIGAVLAGLTNLEGRGLVEAAYGRYRFGAGMPLPEHER